MSQVLSKVTPFPLVSPQQQAVEQNVIKTEIVQSNQQQQSEQQDSARERAQELVSESYSLDNLFRQDQKYMIFIKIQFGTLFVRLNNKCMYILVLLLNSLICQRLLNYKDSCKPSQSPSFRICSLISRQIVESSILRERMMQLILNETLWFKICVEIKENKFILEQCESFGEE